MNLERVYAEWFDDDERSPPVKLFGPRFGMVLTLLLLVAFLLVLLLCAYALFRRGPVDEPL